MCVRNMRTPRVDTAEVWGQRVVREKMRVAPRGSSQKAFRDPLVITNPCSFLMGITGGALKGMRTEVM